MTLGELHNKLATLTDEKAKLDDLWYRVRSLGRTDLEPEYAAQLLRVSALESENVL
jgi:hypothetical protein